MVTDGKAQGGNPGPTGQKRQNRIIRLVKSGDEEPAQEKPRRPEREALVRTQVAVIALRDALRDKGLDARRESFLLARGELREAIHRIEADLDRLPSCECGPWRVREERLDRVRVARLEREKGLEPAV